MLLVGHDWLIPVLIIAAMILGQMNDNMVEFKYRMFGITVLVGLISLRLQSLEIDDLVDGKNYLRNQL